MLLQTDKALSFYRSMFISTCKRLRIMKGSEARGLGCLWNPQKTTTQKEEGVLEVKLIGWGSPRSLVSDRNTQNWSDLFSAGISLSGFSLLLAFQNSTCIKAKLGKRKENTAIELQLYRGLNASLVYFVPQYGYVSIWL